MYMINGNFKVIYVVDEKIVDNCYKFFFVWGFVVLVVLLLVFVNDYVILVVC